MKKDGLILPILVLFSIMFMLSFVSSALTINTPTLNQAVNGTFLFNVTSGLTAVQNCTFSTTADSSFAFTTNSSGTQTEFTNSTNTATKLTNAYLTTLTVVCRNDSASETATKVFSVDNSNPTCSFLLSSTFVKRQSGLGISTTQNSAGITTLTYAWNLTNELGVQKATSTDSAPTFSNGNLEDLGQHTLSLIVTNQVGTTASCNNTFLVKSANEETVEQVVTQTTVKNNYLTILIVGGIILFLVVIAVLVFLFLNETKKNKRRK